jgi:hypothetical protein
MSYKVPLASTTDFGLVQAGTGITITNGVISVTGGSASNPLYETTVTLVSYAATNDDYYIGVNSAVPVTVTLPTGTDGKMFIIKDELGPGSGDITIQGTGGETIDGAANFVNTVDYGSVSVIFRGTEWHVI